MTDNVNFGLVSRETFAVIAAAGTRGIPQPGDLCCLVETNLSHLEELTEIEVCFVLMLHVDRIDGEIQRITCVTEQGRMKVSWEYILGNDLIISRA